MLLTQRNCATIYHEALGELARRGLMAGIARVDWFGSVSGAERFALYGHGLGDAQRSFSAASAGVRAEVVFVDLDRADDVSYILAERDMLLAASGIEPVTMCAQRRGRLS